MRFAPVALVLVVGAGVVLWFGNTLNSWVLGGLIGGLAALLISIPISLTLFFHFSQRHEERLRAQEELALEQAQAYEEEAVEVYEANDYMLSEEQRWYEEERAFNQRASMERYLPAPDAPRLPPPGQSARRQGTGQPGTGKIAGTRQSLPNDQTYYPGSPGQERSFRSKHQTAALRSAMEEAAQQDGRTGKTSAYPTRKSPSARPTTPFEQADRTGELRSTRNPARQNPNQQYRPRRAVEDTAMPPTSAQRRSLPAAGESSASRSSRHYEPDTEQLRGRYQQTGPVNEQSYQKQQQTGQLRQQQTGSMKQQTGQLRQQQTGQLTRNPRIEEQPRNPDAMTGNLRNSMIRRAPYMYEDDPLRDELAQMVEPPSVRRSSRRDGQQYYEK